MRRPDFFIIGAPKCGTTSLAGWLSDHPRIFFSSVKEPNYFNTDRKFMGRRTTAEYEGLFEGAGPDHKAVGEGSTSYLVSEVAVQKILEYSPGARFIVCLRDPVEMAISLHGQFLKMGIETESDFETAWKLQENRADGRDLPLLSRNVGTDSLQYSKRCLLGRQLERLYRDVNRDRILVLLLEDMKRNPGGEYRRVLTFLGLEDDGRSEFPVHNPAEQMPMRFAQILQTVTQLKRFLGVRRRFGLLRPIERRIRKPGGKSSIRDAFRGELCDYFRDDVLLLQDIIGRDLSHWQPLGTGLK